MRVDENMFYQHKTIKYTVFLFNLLTLMQFRLCAVVTLQTGHQRKCVKGVQGAGFLG